MKRHLLPCLAVAGFLGLAATILWLAAEAFAAAQQRSQEYRYLFEALDSVDRPADTVTWTEPVQPLARSVTRDDKDLVATALTQAWRGFAAASDTGQTDLLADHFVGIALSRAKLAATEAWNGGTRMVILEQSARPEFLHLDGSVFQVSAKATTVRYAVHDGKLAQLELTRDTVVTTLTNETTGWRIFSHERTSSQPIRPASPPAFTLPRLVGMNYYPARTPWRRFWPEFDASVVAADLDLVASLGGNAVRIFLPVADFGPDADGIANLQKLQAFLSLAQDRDIRIIPTLFDLKPGYRPAVWADDLAYLRRVLPVLAASPAVALVDLKNEPDLDRDAQGAGLVDAWLSTMARLSRQVAPDLPLTIGWSSASAATDLADLVDALSYHDYAPVDDAAARLEQVRSRAQGKPVLVTEVGTSSYELAFGLPGSADRQASTLQTRLDALAQADGVLIWTLHDFSPADTAAVGGTPWRHRLQAHFGLFDLAGVAKPAARVVAAAFGGTGRND